MTPARNARAVAGAVEVDGPVRYFQIGFAKCGTTALAAFFNRCGIPCVHHDRGRLARRIRENLATGARPLAGYDHRYLAFTDMTLNEPDDYVDAFKEYHAFRRAYRAKFILNTRPVEHWIRSIMEHEAKRPREQRFQIDHLRFGTTDPARVAACWRAEWEAYHRRVRAEIPPGLLLVFDIESDPPERLCDFIGVPRSHARDYRLENPSLNAVGRFLAACVPLAVKRAIPEPLKLSLKRLLRARRRASPRGH